MENMKKQENSLFTIFIPKDFQQKTHKFETIREWSDKYDHRSCPYISGIDLTKGFLFPRS